MATLPRRRRGVGDLDRELFPSAIHPFSSKKMRKRSPSPPKRQIPLTQHELRWVTPGHPQATHSPVPRLSGLDFDDPAQPLGWLNRTGRARRHRVPLLPFGCATEWLSVPPASMALYRAIVTMLPPVFLR